MADEQDQAEGLDDDVVSDGESGDGGGPDPARFEALPAEDSPPDEPLGVDDPGAAGASDSVSEREWREEPSFEEASGADDDIAEALVSNTGRDEDPSAPTG